MSTGMFITCSRVWDNNTQSYREADVTDVAKCCASQCEKPVKFCNEYCHRLHGPSGTDASPYYLARCLNTCSSARELCLDTCSLSNPAVGTHSDYLDCAREHGCAGELDALPSQSCIHNYKDKIFECCRHRCIPTKDLDCQKNCEYIQRVMLDPNFYGTPEQEISTQLPFTVPDEKPGLMWVYILGALLLVFMIGILRT